MNLARIRRWAKDDRQIVANVHLILSGADKSMAEMARIMGISARTLYQRLKRPDTFTVRELRILDWVADLHGIKTER